MRRYINAAYAAHLTEDSPQATQPPWIRTPLRPHQLTLLAAARALEERSHLNPLEQLQGGGPRLISSYGVLADRVGAGKSLVALSMVRDPPVIRDQFVNREMGGANLISTVRTPLIDEFKTEWHDISGARLFAHMFADRKQRFHLRTALIVVPHNIIPQWETYVRDHTDLRVHFIRRTKDCDYERPGFYQDVFEADAVIVSNTMYRKFTGAMQFHGPGFYRLVWSRLFVDEADTVPVYEISARFYWFITGSWLNTMFPRGLYGYTLTALPDDLRAKLGDGAITGICGGLIREKVADGHHPLTTQLILRNSDAWLEASLTRPVIVHETVICKAPANIAMLQQYISPTAMEALHAGDTAGAMAALGLKATSKESLAERVTASLRGDLIQAEKTLAFKRDSEYSSVSAKKAAIERAEAKVAELKGRLASLEARIATAATATDNCPICFDAPRCVTLTPCCRNAFCLACLCECIRGKPSCPMCRASIADVKSLIVVGGESAEEGNPSDAGGPPTKGAALLKLLSESTEDQRFLVFSAHEASFAGLRDMLAARGIRCELLQGTAARVERIRKQFRDGVVRVLCMNARNVGAGLNLEAATHIILYHRMNVELERQVIGRAVRFERASELRVVHLVHESETAINGAQSSEIITHL